MRRVLVVDDEPDLLASVVPVLQRHLGARIATADNAEDARTLLLGLDFDLLVTDDRLPGMAGRDLVAWARVVRPRVRVVLMSAWLDDHRQLPARQHPDALLRKPFRASELVDIVAPFVDAPARAPLPPVLAVQGPAPRREAAS